MQRKSSRSNNEINRSRYTEARYYEENHSRVSGKNKKKNKNSSTFFPIFSDELRVYFTEHPVTNGCIDIPDALRDHWTTFLESIETDSVPVIVGYIVLLLEGGRDVKINS